MRMIRVCTQKFLFENYYRLKNEILLLYSLRHAYYIWPELFRDSKTDGNCLMGRAAYTAFSGSIRQSEENQKINFHSSLVFARLYPNRYIRIFT